MDAERPTDIHMNGKKWDIIIVIQNANDINIVIQKILSIATVLFK